MDTEMTASAVIMGEGKMEEERVKRIDKENERWVKSIAALTDKEVTTGLNDIMYSRFHQFSQRERRILIRASYAAKIEERRKELIRILEKDNELMDNTTKTVIKYLKQCEVSP